MELETILNQKIIEEEKDMQCDYYNYIKNNVITENKDSSYYKCLNCYKKKFYLVCDDKEKHIMDNLNKL